MSLLSLKPTPTEQFGRFQAAAFMGRTFSLLIFDAYTGIAARRRSVYIGIRVRPAGGGGWNEGGGVTMSVVLDVVTALATK